MFSERSLRCQYWLHHQESQNSWYLLASQACSKKHHENIYLVGSLGMRFLLPTMFREMAGQPDGHICVELILMSHLIVFIAWLMWLLDSVAGIFIMLNLNRTKMWLCCGLGWLNWVPVSVPLKAS